MHHPRGLCSRARTGMISTPSQSSFVLVEIFPIDYFLNYGNLNFLLHWTFICSFFFKIFNIDLLLVRQQLFTRLHPLLIKVVFPLLLMAASQTLAILLRP